MTPVIFRRFRDGGDLIAIFPTIPGSTMRYCQSYMTVGQHADCDWYQLTGKRFSSPTVPVPLEADYKKLLDELKRIGYDDLKVYRKLRHEFHRIREEAMRQNAG